MTRYTRLALLLLLATTFFSLKAQQYQTTISQDTASYPYWINMMQDPHAGFSATQKAFNTYWADREITRGSGYKPFKTEIQ